MNPAEMAQYRELLLEMRDRLSGQLDLVEEAIPQAINDPTDVSTLPTHPADRDSEGLERDVVVAQSQTYSIQEIDAALQRIDEGTFGRCQRCGRDIPAERLAAIPYTPYCIRCARTAEADAETEANPTMGRDIPWRK